MNRNTRFVSRTRKRRLPVLHSSLARPANDERGGFTLIELLVVMGLIAILATLAIAFFPNAASSQVEARAATQLQSWLTIAKQRALRDQAPRGVRLWIVPAPAWVNTQSYGPQSTVSYNGLVYLCLQANTGTLPTNTIFWVPWQVVTDCQYIEQPPDYPGNSGVTIMTGVPANAASPYSTNPLSCVMFMPPAPAVATGLTGIITNGATTVAVPNVSTQVEYWPVQPGDNLEVLGTGLMHQITQIGVVDNKGNVYPDYVVISPPLPYLVTPTANFRVVRAPRVTGDETLKMPDTTVIDLGTNTSYVNLLPAPNTMDNGSAGFIDILFSPSGEVISPGVTGSNLNLWVRSPNSDNPTDVFRGAPTIISVFTKTGFVGAYPPNPTGTNPYSLIK